MHHNTHTYTHTHTHTHIHTHGYTHMDTHAQHKHILQYNTHMDIHTHTLSTAPVLKKFKVIYFSNVVKVGSGETQTTSPTNC